MGARKSNEQHVRNLTQNSTGTFSLSLPISVVRDLGWRRGQKVVVSLKGGKLVVADWRE
jgi:hypothetical protein